MYTITHTQYNRYCVIVMVYGLLLIQSIVHVAIVHVGHHGDDLSRTYKDFLIPMGDVLPTTQIIVGDQKNS